jgi:hypothetical protein
MVLNIFMELRRIPPEDIDIVITVICEYEDIFKQVYDYDNAYFQNKIKHIRETAHNPNIQYWGMFDDDDALLSLTGMYYAQTMSTLLLIHGTVSKIGRERYGLFEAITMLVKQALTKNEWGETTDEVYLLTRSARARTVVYFLNDYVTTETSLSKNNYVVEEFERIEPFCCSKYKLLGDWLLGPVQGKNIKPLMIIRLYKNKKQ